MKKVIFALAMVTALFATVNAQTSLKPIADCGSVKTWVVVSGNMPVGSAISIEKPDTKCDILFYPKPEHLKGYSLVLTGTYSTATDSVCGQALDNGNNIGSTDPKFNPTGWINVYEDGTIDVDDNEDGVKSIQVYLPIWGNKIDTAEMKKLPAKSIAWKFLVEKQWKKNYSDTTKTSEEGSDFIIVTMNPMPLGQALKILQTWGNEKGIKTKTFTYTSSIFAAVIPSAAYAPMILNGQQVGGVFRQKQSNVIVIK